MKPEENRRRLEDLRTKEAKSPGNWGRGGNASPMQIGPDDMRFLLGLRKRSEKPATGRSAERRYPTDRTQKLG